jgi:Tfp pilus assembly major pilin PilA
MKKQIRLGFTLVELIFIIVIIGVLAGVASTTYKADYLSNDISYITAKIRQAQYKGIGYEHRSFGTVNAPVDYNNGCIRLEKSALEQSATAGEISYRLHVDSFDAGTLCFDAKGRPHDDDFTSGTLLTSKKVIDLSFNGVSKSITILPQSGYAIMPCN